MSFLKTLVTNLAVSAAQLVLLSVMVNHANAQDFAKNAIYGEILGQGFLYSINYERTVVSNITVRVGAMAISGETKDPGEEAKATVKMFPIVLTRLVGSHNHRLEMGMGATVISQTLKGPEGSVWDNKFPLPSSSGTTMVGTASFGYRYQKPSGGIVFRTCLTPFFTFKKFFLWGGLSIGYSF